MIPSRKIFLDNVCYTDLVFGRVNNKLNTNYSIDEIKLLVNRIISDPATVINK